jgi:hypothetical protein
LFLFCLFGVLDANADIVASREVAAAVVDRGVPAAELVKADAVLLVNVVATLARSNLVVLLAVGVGVGQLRLGTVDRVEDSTRDMDTDVVAEEKVGARCGGMC